eukprot:RCo055714
MGGQELMRAHHGGPPGDCRAELRTEVRLGLVGEHPKTLPAGPVEQPKVVGHDVPDLQVRPTQHPGRCNLHPVGVQDVQDEVQHRSKIHGVGRQLGLQQHHELMLAMLGLPALDVGRDELVVDSGVRGGNPGQSAEDFVHAGAAEELLHHGQGRGQIHLFRHVKDRDQLVLGVGERGVVQEAGDLGLRQPGLSQGPPKGRGEHGEGRSAVLLEEPPHLHHALHRARGHVHAVRPGVDLGELQGLHVLQQQCPDGALGRLGGVGGPTDLPSEVRPGTLGKPLHDNDSPPGVHKGHQLLRVEGIQHEVGHPVDIQLQGVGPPGELRGALLVVERGELGRGELGIGLEELVPTQDFPTGAEDIMEGFLKPSLGRVGEGVQPEPGDPVDHPVVLGHDVVLLQKRTRQHPHRAHLRGVLVQRVHDELHHRPDVDPQEPRRRLGLQEHHELVAPALVQRGVERNHPLAMR